MLTEEDDRYGNVAQLAERPTVYREAAGSYPVIPAI